MQTNEIPQIVPAKRPQFLTVLCILSFVGIGFSLLYGFNNYISFSRLAADQSIYSGFNPDGSPIASPFNLDYGKMATSELFSAFLNIPLLFGVLLMWKLRKNGYYIYLASELIQAICPLMIVGGLTGGFYTIGRIIVSIIFVILYGVNLKRLS